MPSSACKNHPVALGPFAKGVVRAALSAQRNAGWTFALFRENLNDACQSARTVQSALRPAHDLDPADIVRSEVGKIKCALQTLIDGNAIEQNLRVFAA